MDFFLIITIVQDNFFGKAYYGGTLDPIPRRADDGTVYNVYSDRYWDYIRNLMCNIRAKLMYLGDNTYELKGFVDEAKITKWGNRHPFNFIIYYPYRPLYICSPWLWPV